MYYYAMITNNLIKKEINQKIKIKKKEERNMKTEIEVNSIKLYTIIFKTMNFIIKTATTTTT
jgi:hypothetical protein